MKAGRVADLAFKKILVGAADSSPEPDEYADFITAMNSYMAALEVRGVVLGYTAVDNVSDELTIPDGAIQGLIANMAIAVAPEYDAPISAALQQEAKQGMTAMRHLGRNKAKMQYPSTLPIGSSNDWEYGTQNQFYGRSAFASMALSGNRTATEFDTAQEVKRVRGDWQTVKAVAMRADVSGRIKNQSRSDVSGTFKVTLKATGDDVYWFMLMRNDAEVLTEVSATLTDLADIALSAGVTLKPDDFLSLSVRSQLTTNPVTVYSGQMEFS